MNLFDKTTKNAVAYKTVYVNPEQHEFYQKHKRVLNWLLHSCADFTFLCNHIPENALKTVHECLDALYNFYPFDRKKNNTLRKQYNRYKEALGKMNEQTQVRTETDTPAICCVYLAFSNDGGIIKIGSTGNLAQRFRDYATDAHMNDHGGIGDIYYYLLDGEHNRYFMEDVLRAAVAQTTTAIKLHAADRFVLKEEVETFKEANFAHIEEVLKRAERWLKTRDASDESLEEFFKNCPII